MQSAPSFLDFRAAYTKNQQDNQYDDEEFYDEYDDYGEEQEQQWSGQKQQRKPNALKQQNLNQRLDTKVNQKLKEHNSQLLAKLLAKNTLNSQDKSTKNPTQQGESQKTRQSQTIRLNLSDKLSRILSNNPHEILKKSLHGIRDQPVQITRNPKYLRNHELMQLKNQFKEGTQGKQIAKGNQELLNQIINGNMIPNITQEKVNTLYKSFGVPQKDANRILLDKENYNDKGNNNKSKGSSEDLPDQRNGIEFFHKQACLLYVANLMLKDQAKELFEDNSKLQKIAEIFEIKEKKSIMEYQSELKQLNKHDKNYERSLKMDEDSDDDDEDDNDNDKNKEIYYSDSQNESGSDVKGQLLICEVKSCQKAYYNKISLKSHTRRKHPRQRRQPEQQEEIIQEKKEEEEEVEIFHDIKEEEDARIFQEKKEEEEEVEIFHDIKEEENEEQQQEKIYFEPTQKASPKPQIKIKFRKNQAW